MKSTAAILCLVLAASVPVLAHPAESPPERPLFELDGGTFVMFYDLPSRRFRAIRQAFLTRDFAAARHDAAISAQYLEIEAQRAHPKLVPLLQQVIDRLRTLANDMEASATLHDFDQLFARAHWLLAQHFLWHGAVSRDAKRFKEAGHYLIASAHHMERTALWSNATIARPLADALDGLRAQGAELQRGRASKWVEENRPLLAGARVLRDLGTHLDRAITVPLD